MMAFFIITILFGLAAAKPVFFSKDLERLTEDLFPPGMTMEMFGKEVFGFRFGANTTMIEIQLAQYLMARFVKSLGLLVNETNFNTELFDDQVNDLEKELAVLTLEVTRLNPQKMVSRLLRYCHHMFQIMRESRYIMKLYTDFSRPGHILVHKVVELGVVALSMSDEYGALDLSKRGYLGKLIRLYHDLNTHVAQFRVLPYVLWATRRLFEVQVGQAEQTLEDLRTWVPI